jgi:hypothetical protein
VGVQAPLVVHGRTEEQRFSSRATAQVEHAVAWLGADAQADELRAFVLDLEEPCLMAREPKDVGATSQEETIRRIRRRFGLDALRPEALDERVPARSEAVDAHDDGPREVRHCGEGFGFGAQRRRELGRKPVRIGEARGPVAGWRPGLARTTELLDEGVEERSG